MQTRQQQQQHMIQAMLHVIDRYVANKTISGPQIIALVKVLFVPQMTYILQKYSEQDFHRVMRQIYTDEYGQNIRGFDFIGDWKKNHIIAFTIALAVGRQFRRELDFNVDTISSLMVDIMRSWGWNIEFHERLSIRHDLVRIKRLLGYNV
jgi:hypothetical protein